jgi:hypothetical protein
MLFTVVVSVVDVRDVKKSRRPEKKRKDEDDVMKNYQKWFSSLFICKRRKKKREILPEYLGVLSQKGFEWRNSLNRR